MKQLQLFQKPMLLLFFLLISSFCISQVTQQWAKKYTSPDYDNDAARAMAIDRFGNVYVTGTSYGTGTDQDYATIKYDAAGNELWVRRYNGPGNSRDAATSLAVDTLGNVYVTGSSNDKQNNEESVVDIVTIKYDAAGNQLWLQRYKYPSNNVSTNAADMAVDAAGNVYITGIGRGSEVLFYITIKYNTSGNKVWEKYYGSEGGGDAVPVAVALDGSGNVYVTGQSSPEYGTIENRYTTLKYNTGGTQLWEQHYNNPDLFDATASALAVDASGNVHVTGNIGTVKYSAGEGEEWVVEDGGTSVAVDGSGNVYVAGAGTTIKYNSAGTELWRRFVRSEGRSFIALDGLGNVYVAESTPNGGENDPDISQFNLSTRKYDAVGNQLWLRFYGSDGNGGATDLVVDGSGNVYVTGYGEYFETGYDYITVKYSQSQTSTVSSLTLINADSDQDVRELKDGDTINLAALSTLNLNIRANTNPATVGSVVFSLSGAATSNSTENIAPHALFADNNKGDYYPWIPANGSYTLTATPHSGSKGSGTKGTPLTIHFTVTGQVVSRLILVNAETDQDIKTLKNGDVIDLSTLPTRKLNIRAVVHPDTVGSVVFNLNNRYIVRENLAPYAIGGDIKGDYRYWTLPTGKHTLTATPYSKTYGKGTKGKTHSVTFTVVDLSETGRAANAEKEITDVQNREGSLRATPNPFSGQTTIHFSVPISGRTVLEVYDMKGAVMARLYEAQAEAGKTYRVPFDSKGLNSGMYMVRLITDKKVQSYKLVLIR
jgi:hypothetical protein